MKQTSACLFVGFATACLCALVSGQSAVHMAVPAEAAAVATTTPKRSFRCIVCDDTKQDHCQPWDRFSHSKDCYEDERINKNLPVGCRKMVQTVNDKVYVSRQCTNLLEENVQGCIDRVGTKRIKVRYCHCFHPECNSARRAAVPATWALQLLFLLCLSGLLSLAGSR